jgi:hypothetical protein
LPDRLATRVLEAQRAPGLAGSSNFLSVSIVICSRQGRVRTFQLARKRARQFAPQSRREPDAGGELAQ